MKDYNVLGKAQEDAPLPDVIETANQLNLLIKFFVDKGWNVWPVPKGTEDVWDKRLQVQKRRWVIGEVARKFRWHFAIIGMLKEEFPEHLQTIAQFKLGKYNGDMGALIVRKPLPMDNVLRFLQSCDLIKMAGRA